ncbi:MAG: hypothetical protein RIQ93_2073, partial [Verrucomicrobiota bacterium]
MKLLHYPLLGVALVLFCRALSIASAAESVVPGSKLLTIQQPLDEMMVAGIDRFALRELAASPARRDALWRRDYSSPAAYAQSIAAARERFREHIGAVDPRVAATDFEPLVTLGRDARVGEAESFTVVAVRWQVLAGITGEGLLLQPKSALKGRAV